MGRRVNVIVETNLTIDIEDDSVDLDEVIVDMDMDFVSTTDGAEVVNWSNTHHSVVEDDEKAAIKPGGDSFPEDTQDDEDEEDDEDSDEDGEV